MADEPEIELVDVAERRLGDDGLEHLGQDAGGSAETVNVGTAVQRRAAERIDAREEARGHSQEQTLLANVAVVQGPLKDKKGRRIKSAAGDLKTKFVNVFKPVAKKVDPESVMKDGKVPTRTGKVTPERAAYRAAAKKPMGRVEWKSTTPHVAFESGRTPQRCPGCHSKSISWSEDHDRYVVVCYPCAGGRGEDSYIVRKKRVVSPCGVVGDGYAEQDIVSKPVTRSETSGPAETEASENLPPIDEEPEPVALEPVVVDTNGVGPTAGLEDRLKALTLEWESFKAAAPTCSKKLAPAPPKGDRPVAPLVHPVVGDGPSAGTERTLKRNLLRKLKKQADREAKAKRGKVAAMKAAGKKEGGVMSPDLGPYPGLRPPRKTPISKGQGKGKPEAVPRTPPAKVLTAEGGTQTAPGAVATTTLKPEVKVVLVPGRVDPLGPEKSARHCLDVADHNLLAYLSLEAVGKVRDQGLLDVLKRKAKAWCDKNRPEWGDVARLKEITNALAGAMIQSTEERRLTTFLSVRENRESTKEGSALAGGTLRTGDPKYVGVPVPFTDGKKLHVRLPLSGRQAFKLSSAKQPA